jgi:hypothetical protein
MSKLSWRSSLLGGRVIAVQSESDCVRRDQLRGPLGPPLVRVAPLSSQAFAQSRQGRGNTRVLMHHGPHFQPSAALDLVTFKRGRIDRSKRLKIRWPNGLGRSRAYAHKHDPYYARRPRHLWSCPRIANHSKITPIITTSHAASYSDPNGCRTLRDITILLCT